MKISKHLCLLAPASNQGWITRRYRDQDTNIKKIKLIQFWASKT